MTLGTVRGLIDAENRLVEADPSLLALQRRAGGEEGGRLAIPPLASLVRIVRRLGVVVARPLTVAEADTDLELFVRASPEGDGVTLAIAGWQSRPARHPAPALAAVRRRDEVRAAADWTWEVDAGLTLVAISPQAEWLLGRSASLLVGRPLTELFHLLPDGNGRQPLQDALGTHTRFDAQLAELRDRSSFRVRLSGHPLIDADGHLSGFRGSAVRVPPAGVAQADGAAQPVAAERLSEALRNPLGRIIRQAEAIGMQEDGPLRRDYADYATDIAAAARHLLALVDDLVDLDAIERADFKPLVEPIDLADVARRAAGLLGVRAAAADLLIERPAAEAHVAALGDYRRVLQIAVNLLGNAVRHAPRGSRVVLRTETDGHGARLQVIDQGPGIAPQDQERAFAKFVRLRPADGEGSGLGLYISRRLARAMDGDLLLASTPGAGSCFTLLLPAPAP